MFSHLSNEKILKGTINVLSADNLSSDNSDNPNNPDNNPNYYSDLTLDQLKYIAENELIEEIRGHSSYKFKFTTGKFSYTRTFNIRQNLFIYIVLSKPIEYLHLILNMYPEFNVSARVDRGPTALQLLSRFTMNKSYSDYFSKLKVILGKYRDNENKPKYNINYYTENFDTALNLAAIFSSFESNIEVVRMLLEAGASQTVNRKMLSKNNLTENCGHAGNCGHYPFVISNLTTLLMCTVMSFTYVESSQKKVSTGMTVKFSAPICNYNVIPMLANASNVNLVGEDGIGCFHFLATQADSNPVDIISDCLIKHSANVNIVDEKQHTPLDIIANYSYNSNNGCIVCPDYALKLIRNGAMYDDSLAHHYLTQRLINDLFTPKVNMEMRSELESVKKLSNSIADLSFDHGNEIRLNVEKIKRLTEIKHKNTARILTLQKEVATNHVVIEDLIERLGKAEEKINELVSKVNSDASSELFHLETYSSITDSSTINSLDSSLNSTVDTSDLSSTDSDDSSIVFGFDDIINDKTADKTADNIADEYAGSEESNELSIADSDDSSVFTKLKNRANDSLMTH